MAYKVKKGTWTADGNTTQAITGVGFTPKAIIVWGQGPGAAGTITATSIFSFGFATRRGGTTQERQLCIWYQDNVGTSSASKMWTVRTGAVLSAEGVEDYNFLTDSFDTDGFTVTYSSGAAASGDIWHYIALGGDDLVDANVIEETWPTSGTFDITGFGFDPDAVIMVTGVGTAQGAGSVTSHAHMSIGAWGGAAAPTFVAATFAEDGQTMASNMQNNGFFSSSAILCTVSQQATPSDTLDGVAGISSAITDGYTMGNTNGPAAAQRVFCLGLKGGTYDSDTMAHATTAAADTWTGSNGLVRPVLAFFARPRCTSDGTIVANAFGLIVGATDGTTDGDGMYQGNEAINTQGDRVHHTDSVLREIDTSNPPANVRKATFTSFGPQTVTLTWDAGGGNAFHTGVLLIGSKPTPPVLRHPIRQWSPSRTAW